VGTHILSQPDLTALALGRAALDGLRLGLGLRLRIRLRRRPRLGGKPLRLRLLVFWRDFPHQTGVTDEDTLSKGIAEL
jgi:hypothetical protein